MTKKIHNDKDKISWGIESQEQAMREREICLSWQGERWPVGGWRLKILHPESSVIWGDLSINLRAFRLALERLSDGVKKEMVGGRQRTSTFHQIWLNHMTQA